MSLGDIAKDAKLALAKEKKVIIETSDLVKELITVMEAVKEYPNKRVQILVSDYPYSLRIGYKSLGLKEPTGFISELLMSGEKETIDTLKAAIQRIINEDKIVKTILAVATSGEADITIKDIEG